MELLLTPLPPRLRRIRGFAVLTLLLMASGCIGITGAYVDPTLPPASAADVRPANHPTSVQVLVEFRANDVPKASATSFVQKRLLDIARRSGLFSTVSTTPVDSGRRLVVTINNYPGDRQGSPVATGLTLGLAGTRVTDRYHCEAQYDVAGREPVSLVYEHALISKIGAAAGPPGLTSYPLNTAAEIVFDQLGWSIMRDLAAKGATEE
jgi:hypothetical protein